MNLLQENNESGENDLRIIELKEEQADLHSKLGHVEDIKKAMQHYREIYTMQE